MQKSVFLCAHRVPKRIAEDGINVFGFTRGWRRRGGGGRHDGIAFVWRTSIAQKKILAGFARTRKGSASSEYTVVLKITVDEGSRSLGANVYSSFT